MPNTSTTHWQGIPSKGEVLTGISTFWFDLLTSDETGLVPSHVLSASTNTFPQALKTQLESHSGALHRTEGRSMLVRRARVVPIEAIVRGYLSGSGWGEYKRSQTVHGIPLPAGLEESAKIPDGPLFTPSTKAEQGEHDENIHPDRVPEILGGGEYGTALAAHLAQTAKAVYARAAEHAAGRGLILADTKFEFGLVPRAHLPDTKLVQRQPGFVHPETGVEEVLILVDEVLTPDSSRFWDASAYQVGRSQTSFDKQFVRDFLLETKLIGPDKQPTGGKPILLPDNIVSATRLRYIQAFEKITGTKFAA